jgi:hypothetical protein
MEDWYSLTEYDFFENGGTSILTRFGSSPVAVLKDAFPKHRWKEWLFVKVPERFWDDPANQKRYLRWLGKKLGYKRSRDWEQATNKDFATNHGAGLVAIYGSHIRLLKECVPGFREEVSRHRAATNWLRTRRGRSWLRRNRKR